MEQISQSALGTSSEIEINSRVNPFSLGIGLVVSGTLTVSIQHTYDGVTWFDKVAGATASTETSYSAPVKAIRLNVTAFTSGSATLTMIQAGVKKLSAPTG